MPMLDQYGHPFKPVKVDADIAGMNPGYKCVSNDGKGTSVWREYCPVTGIMRELHMFPDGTRKQKKWQNVSAIVDMNKVYTADYKPHSKAKMQRQTAIPSINFWDIMEKCGHQPGKNGGEYDKKKFDQIINDIDNRAFKTVPGKISCQYRTWY